MMVKTFLTAAAAVGYFTFFGATSALACVAGDINCNQPTGVARGQTVPIWHVVACVTGPEGGPYTEVDCQSQEALHISPLGEEVVCFIGSDGKIHWDYQHVVRIGNRFFNHNVGGRWQPNWQ